MFGPGLSWVPKSMLTMSRPKRRRNSSPKIMKLVVANWKMNPETAAEAKKLAIAVDRGLSKRSRIATVICPPFVFLPAVKPAISSAKLGSQDLAPHEGIPLTGEISAAQLKGFGVSYVIVGHSERRALGETDQQVNQKIRRSEERRVGKECRSRW